MAKITTIDWVEDAELENKKGESARFHSTGNGLKDRAYNLYVLCQGWLVLAAAGAIIGVIAVMLNIITGLLVDLKSGYCSGGFYLNESFCCWGEEENCAMWHSWTNFGLAKYFIYVVFSVLFAFLASFLVLELAPFAAGSGISEIKCIVSGYLIPGFLGFKTLALKSLTLPLTIASGFSVGKEGPSVHYAACVGNVISEFFDGYRQHNSKRRDLLTACSAAGVAVAFGSPIGGVLFSIEEISPVNIQIPTIWRSYFCCLVATGVLAMLNPFRSGQMVLFSVTYDQPWHFFDIPAFIILGMFGGLMGEFIIKWNLRFQALRKQYLKSWALQEVTLIALITAAVCYFNEFLFVDMTKSMQILFHECEHGWSHPSCDVNHQGRIAFSLILALIIRTALVLVSYGAKVPAGIFVPSLAIGALFGRLVGVVMWALQRKFPDSFVFAGCIPNQVCINPGSYAFLGAGALLAGVMHITITVVVILFELTGAVMYVVPSMIVIGITKFIGDALGSQGGIADMAIVSNDYPVLTDELELEGVVEDVMQPPTGVYVNQMPPEPLSHPTYPVLDEEGHLLASVRSEDVHPDVEFDIEATKVNLSPIMVVPGTPLDWIHEIFIQLAPRIIFVTDKGKLLGIVTRRDLVNKFKATLSAPSELEHKIVRQLAAYAERLFGK